MNALGWVAIGLALSVSGLAVFLAWTALDLSKHTAIDAERYRVERNEALANLQGRLRNAERQRDLFRVPSRN